jgi:hypothetical protein
MRCRPIRCRPLEVCPRKRRAYEMHPPMRCTSLRDACGFIIETLPHLGVPVVASNDLLMPPKPTATSIIRPRPIPIEILDDSPPRPAQRHRVISTAATSAPGRVQIALQQKMVPRQPAPPSAWYNFTIFLARPQSDGRDWDHFLRAMNTRLTNEPIDGFSTFHALLLSAAKSPLSRLDDLRFVRPELDGAGDWIMAYNKPTSLRVPLSNVMEWSGKRIFTDIFKEETIEEEQESASTKKIKKREKKGKAASRLSLGSPEKLKKARTRLQAQLKEKTKVAFADFVPFWE